MQVRCEIYIEVCLNFLNSVAKVLKTPKVKINIELSIKAPLFVEILSVTQYVTFFHELV